MKNKWLLLALLPLLLASCQKKATLSASLEEDEATLSSSDIKLNIDSNDYFSFNYSYSLSSDGKYLCHWTIGNSLKTYTKARVLISPDNSTDKYFFFGYEADYTLMKKDGKADSGNLVYRGFAINFSYSEIIIGFKVLFSSNELVRAFTDSTAA